MQHPAPPCRRLSLPQLRDVVYHATHGAADTDALTRAIDVLDAQTALETAARPRDAQRLAWLRHHRRALAKERQRRWNADWEKKAADQLERDHGAALDAMSDDERDALLAAICTARGWNIDLARRCPNRTALLRALADRLAVP